ncbi:MAG: hypothetical protein ACOCY1_02850 [Halovenus sp.]
METQEIILGEERDRLDKRLDELAEQLATADEVQTLQRAASSIETQGAAVAQLCEEFGDDTTVAVRGLNAGEYAKVEDEIARYREEADGNPTPGARKNVFAAMGLVDGPFDGFEDAEELSDYLAIVAEQPVGVRDWLYAKVNDLTTVSSQDFRPLSERIADSQG